MWADARLANAVSPIRGGSARVNLGLLLCLCLCLCLCACYDIGLGAPGMGTPLPTGGLPVSQTLEGGAQIRLSSVAVTKIVTIGEASLVDEIAQGVCVSPLNVAGTDACYSNQGTCAPGCAFAFGLDSVSTTLPIPNTIRVSIQASASASVPVRPAVGFACVLTLSVGSLFTIADVDLAVDATTGSFLASGPLNDQITSSGVSHSGCTSVANLEAIVTGVVDSMRTAFVNDAVFPVVNATINDFLPTPRELAARVDLPALLLTGPAASNSSGVETRLVTGGYAALLGGGLSLGVITGFNSDSDPQTRSSGLASEPDACVSGLSAPDLSLPPASLSITSRGTLGLPVAGPFAGMPEPADDLTIGVSRTALDLAGHHIVASGGICLTLDSTDRDFVRRDALDDLLGIPLSATDEELRLSVYPQQGIYFAIGSGGVGSPHLEAVFEALEFDVDAVVVGVPTTLMTLTADVTLGLNLGTRRDAGLPLGLEPTLTAFTVANPAVAVFDPRYAALSAPDLDVLAGTLADVVFSALGADAAMLRIPGPAGLTVGNVSVGDIITASDDFLTVSASLGGTAPILGVPAPMPQPLSTTLVLPTQADVRTALLADDDAGLPTVHVALPVMDGARLLEHAWRTEGGAWHPYEAVGDLVIRDRSFAWQGERTIELRSRIVGDDSTTSSVGATTVSLDGAPPAIFSDQATFLTYLIVPARDAVSLTLEWAIGRVGENSPATDWTTDPNLDAATALSLGDVVIVYVRDELGNVARSTEIELVPEPSAALGSACACALLALLRRTCRQAGQPVQGDSVLRRRSARISR